MTTALTTLIVGGDVPEVPGVMVDPGFSLHESEMTGAEDLEVGEVCGLIDLDGNAEVFQVVRKVFDRYEDYIITLRPACGPVLPARVDHRAVADLWLERYSPRWMHAEVSFHLGVGGMFDRVIAAAITTEAHPAGAGRKWLSRLSPESLDTLEAFAEVEAGRLLERLEPGVARGDAWIEALAEMLRARDNLSRVYSVLDDHERGSGVGAALALFDRVARPVVEDTPPRVVIDARLKAASSNPEAWWAMPARHDEES